MLIGLGHGFRRLVNQDDCGNREVDTVFKKFCGVMMSQEIICLKGNIFIRQTQFHHKMKILRLIFKE